MAGGKTGVDCGVPCIRFVCNLTICMSALVSLCIQYMHLCLCAYSTYVCMCALVSLCIRYIRMHMCTCVFVHTVHMYICLMV